MIPNLSEIILIVNYYATSKSAAEFFLAGLSNVYQDSTFHIIHSEDLYYICGEICLDALTIDDHKYQIDYFAYYCECNQYMVDSAFYESDSRSLMYRKAV